MVDLIQQSDTTHNYSGGNVGSGALTVDGDYGTYYGNAGGDFATGSGGSFGSTATVVSEHVFSSPFTILKVKFKIQTSGSSTSSTDNAHHTQYAIQYQLEGSAVWTNFAGASNGSNGSFSPGEVEITPLAVENVKKVRVTVANAGSFHNDDGNHQWDLRIYEVEAWGELGGYAFMV